FSNHNFAHTYSNQMGSKTMKAVKISIQVVVLGFGFLYVLVKESLRLLGLIKSKFQMSYKQQERAY
ncbi:MAG: hypothetical protein NTW30_04795, partial [Candidatus Aenigmarchaeota archaeon]|nr:hypothetical protein [Candidatus Aenigmarchaeota archaeon]